MGKYSFGISIAALMLASGAAVAADPIAPMDPVVEYDAGNWTGVYVGGHAGYGLGATTDSLDCGGDMLLGSVSWISGRGVGCDGLDEFDYPVAITALENDDPAPWHTYDDLSEMEGWLAGLQVGYRHQMGSFVFGAEVSGSVSAISDTGTTWIEDSIITELDEFGGIYEGTMDINWLVLAQAKLGFALTDDFLVSAMGGLALAGTEFSSSAGYSDAKVAQGFTVGAQADYKIDKNVSVFGAYNYSWFNDVSYEGNSLAGLIANFHEYDLALHTFKVGFNYQLD